MDTDILIPLAKADTFGVLHDLSPHRFHTTEVNLLELKQAASRKPAMAALEAKTIGLMLLDSLEEILLYAYFRSRADPGESAALAGAAARDGILASHDRKALRLAQNHDPSVRTMRFEEIMNHAVQQGRLSMQDLKQLAKKLHSMGERGLFTELTPSVEAVAD